MILAWDNSADHRPAVNEHIENAKKKENLRSAAHGQVAINRTAPLGHPESITAFRSLETAVTVA
ncbi:MAG: hypothetical protein ACI8Q6_004033 [Granulosicoccus sp.]|jgi:hypothetical protein